MNFIKEFLLNLVIIFLVVLFIFILLIVTLAILHFLNGIVGLLLFILWISICSSIAKVILDRL